MKGRALIAALGVLAKVLPGDHIHHVAPSSKDAPTFARLAAIDAANRKRARKLAKRAKR